MFHDVISLIDSFYLTEVHAGWLKEGPLLELSMRHTVSYSFLVHWRLLSLMCARSEEEFLKTFVSRSNYKGDGANVLRATWREDEAEMWRHLSPHRTAFESSVGIARIQ